MNVDKVNSVISRVTDDLCNMNVAGNHDCDKDISKTYTFNEGLYKSLQFKMNAVDSYSTWELSLSSFDLFGLFSRDMRTCKRVGKENNLFRVFILLIFNK